MPNGVETKRRLDFAEKEMTRSRFLPPSKELYELQKLAREMSLLSVPAQKMKSKEFFSQALRFLGKETPCKTIGGGPL